MITNEALLSIILFHALIDHKAETLPCLVAYSSFVIVLSLGT